MMMSKRLLHRCPLTTIDGHAIVDGKWMARFFEEFLFVFLLSFGVFLVYIAFLLVLWLQIVFIGILRCVKKKLNEDFDESSISTKFDKTLTSDFLSSMRWIKLISWRAHLLRDRNVGCWPSHEIRKGRILGSCGTKSDKKT